MVNDLILFVVYLAVLVLLAWPLSRYIAKVFTCEKTFLDPVFRPL
ncbi:MAG: kdpA 2, partial [Firmicutes bacterium]|nr:kdpA 2 [Bacillota bacterium]